MSDVDRLWAELLHAVTHPEQPDDWKPPVTPPVRHRETHEATPEVQRDVIPAATVGTAQGSQAVGTAQGSQDDGPPAEPSGAPAWSAYLRADSPELLTIVHAVRQIVLRNERRARARTTAALRVFNLTVEALVCSVIREEERGAGPIRVGTDKADLSGASRYRSELHTEQLPNILRLMCAERFLYMSSPAERPRTCVVDGRPQTIPGRQAEYRMGDRLAALAGDALHSDILRVHGDEVILLKGRKDDHKAPELVEYQRAPAVVSDYRAEVRAINEFRQRADIRWMGDPRRVDVYDRHCRRYFTRERWDNGGRLFGGWWRNLKKADRINLTQIEREPVVSIDFSATIPALAYAHAGHTIPSGDLYAFNVIDKRGAVVETTRTERKRMFNALLNGARDWPKELRDRYRPRLSWRRVNDAIRSTHPLIAHLFDDEDIGQALAFKESTIMLAVLTRLQSAGVVALDVHDCIVVKRSALDVAREVMLSEFQRIAGRPGKVTVEEPENQAPAPIELEDF